MNLYSTWINAEGKAILVSNMDSDYITNCIRQIKKCADAWRFDSFNDLKPNELKMVCEPLQKAWFVVNARPYLYSFMEELKARNEDVSYVKQVLEYLECEK
ncbi:MAG: hypothetical protein IJA43_02225 [Clostridia bacterium]|nr:hypothetical protein [Clostridia bacterium]